MHLVSTPQRLQVGFPPAPEAIIAESQPGSMRIKACRVPYTGPPQVLGLFTI